ncbi:MAG TPA: N,N-dimethylformamidase beta subunit family domain-containing protein [Thermoanaerobaculia bacterium]|nr:N,N-dimethylformamidase beta subunit family domain-containing protein [Thermoanaerobaculia bacterium]
MGNFPAQRQHPVEAYASAASVRQGDSIGFHVAVAAPTEEDVQLEVFHYAQLQFDAKRLQEKLSAIGVFDEDYREAIAVAPEEEPLYRAEFPGPVLPPPAYPTPGPGEKPDASRGCGWPEAHRLTVPADWKSGPYLARFGAAEAVTWVLFVVRPAAGQRSARILCALATNTYQAYNPWNDNSFYADLPKGTAQAAKLSFDRPNHLFGFLLFDQSFLAWLDQGYEVDYGANHDLHAEADPLAGYRLFLSLGHDEYWSAEMRDRVESFVEAGGNAAFFSGNTCYWQVRFEDGDRTLVCYKDAALDRQANPGIPAERATAVWYDPPISRPTNDLTGLSYRSAAAITDQPRAAIGFTVADRRSWVFAGTGLADGAVFGQKDAIVGYECDARDFDTPRGFHTLAAVGLGREWTGNGAGREGTVGLFRQGKGCVFSAGTTGWGQGLRTPPDPQVERITQNVLDRLQTPIGHALYAVTPDGDLQRYEDWRQDGTGGLEGPRTIGRGGWQYLRQVFSGRDGVVYAVGPNGDLLWYGDPSGDGTADLVGPKVIGQGWNAYSQVTAGRDGVLYAVDGSGNLLWFQDGNRDGTGKVQGPKILGRGGWSKLKQVTAGDDGSLYAVDGKGQLLWYQDAKRDGTGKLKGPKVIGLGGWGGLARVFAGDHGVIYAVTADGNLHRYVDVSRDGSQPIVGPFTGGWNRFIRLT